MNGRRIIPIIAILFLGIWVLYCQKQLNALCRAVKLQAEVSEDPYAREQARIEQQKAREAVSKVAARRAELRRKAIHAVKPTTIPIIGQTIGDTNEVAMAEFLPGLQSISTEGCPKKFRLAWLDYVHACERAAEYPTLRKLEDVVQSVGSWNNPAVLKEVEDRASRRDIREAWRQCQRVALEFDVEIAADPPL